MAPTHAPTELVSPLAVIVDDDADFCVLVERWLQSGGFTVQMFQSAESFLEHGTPLLPDVVCIDLGLPEMGGMELLCAIQQRHPRVPAIVLTSDTAVNTVVQAMQTGAYDYLAKPIEKTKLIATVKNAATQYRMSLRLERLERNMDQAAMDGMYGSSSVMQRLYRQIEKVAGSDITVLIHGESGTGKELVAQAIHSNSDRRGGAFVAVNCAAVPDSLQDSGFFGHDKGAFTGAEQTKKGWIERAHRGTLFLDEVAELSLSLQAKLLRAIQERCFERVGGGTLIESDFRLVVATHRDLASMVRAGEFREDLFYRIAVLELEIPPLRAREGDLETLVAHFLGEFGAERQGLQLEEGALKAFQRYAWPGNVRELRNVLQRAIVIADGDSITTEDLPDRLRERAEQPEEGTGSAPDREPPQEMTLEELERWAIERTIAASNGNMSEAIRKLGIGRTTLYRKLKQYGLR